MYESIRVTDRSSVSQAEVIEECVRKGMSPGKINEELERQGLEKVPIKKLASRAGKLRKKLRETGVEINVKIGRQSPLSDKEIQIIEECAMEGMQPEEVNTKLVEKEFEKLPIKLLRSRIQNYRRKLKEGGVIVAPMKRRSRGESPERREADALMWKLVGDGLSGSEIVDTMKEKGYEITRNVVIKRVHQARKNGQNSEKGKKKVELVPEPLNGTPIPLGNVPKDYKLRSFASEKPTRDDYNIAKLIASMLLEDRGKKSEK